MSYCETAGCTFTRKGEGCCTRCGALPKVTRSAVAAEVLAFLRNPIRAITRPDREAARALARDYALTAEDLIDAATQYARRA